VFGRSGGSGGGGFGSAQAGLRRSSVSKAMAAGNGIKSKSRATDSAKPSMDMRDEVTLERLEKMPDNGNLTPAEKRDKLLALKLDESLRKLAASGDTKPVEVRVTLRDFSDDVIAKLEALGFKLLAKATTVKLVIGTIPADKLEELALLKVVRSVDPGK
jgi:ribosomal protein L15